MAIVTRRYLKWLQWSIEERCERRAMDFKGPARERPRCLGAAISTALHLMAHLGDEEGHTPSSEPHPSQQDMSRASRAATSGRILAITTGPTTKVGVSTK